MASPKPVLNIPLAIILSLSLSLLHGALAEIVCEKLPKELCTFSIASSGKRCLLENSAGKDGSVEYQCRTSEVVVERMADMIESEECVKSCGIDRNSVGISSDTLLEPQATAKISSLDCYQNCPNIVDLYFNLAAGEGVFLPDLCEAQRTNPHRAMLEFMSSGGASGPATSEYAEAPLGSSLFADAPVESSLYADAPAQGSSFYADAPVPESSFYADSPAPGSSFYADAPASGLSFDADSPAPGSSFYADAPAPGLSFDADSPAPVESSFDEDADADADADAPDVPAPPAPDSS